jgi:hypothetical protein
MRSLLATLLFACTVGTDDPATVGSASHDAAERVGAIATQAAELQALSHELTSLVDESRRQVADGRSTTAAEIEKMQALMAQIEAKNATLQAAVVAVQTEAHVAAGDPAPPAPPAKRR